MHSCLLIERRVCIDCGADWLDKMNANELAAIVLTHAHPDHADGLRHGAPCKVYATQDTWRRLNRWPIRDRAVISARRPFTIASCRLEAFPVEHSLIAPAVGYRITVGGVSVFYVPDVAAILNRHEALSGVVLYIGDGASIVRPLLRRRNSSQIGHASIRDQLDWCCDENVRNVVITHCGSQIVRGDSDVVRAKIKTLGDDRGMEVVVARDGLDITITRSGLRHSGAKP
jgi:phosphoribosyl 1,2-cyclic phosphodiesterase